MALGASSLARLDRAWRTLATLLCFAVFMGGSFLAGPLALILLALAPSVQRRRMNKALVRAFFRLFIGLMRVLGVLSVDLEGLVGLRGPGLFIVSNHPTLIDFVLLASIVPRADCLVKASLRQHWAMRGPVRLAGYIPNDLGQETLDRCRLSLDAGNSIVVFAEGTRTPADQLPVLKRGAAQLALRCGRQVTQVILDCPSSNLEKNGAWYLAPARKISMRVRVLPPMETEPFMRENAGQITLAARALTARLEGRFHEVLRHG